MRLAERLVLGRVAVDELGDVDRESLPVVDELRFADQLADPAADHVQADDGALGRADELDEALRPENLALAISAEVVGQHLDLVAVLLLGPRLGQAHRRDLGLGVGDPRDAGLVDDRRVLAGGLLGDEDALLEAAGRELEAGDDVADREHAGHVGAQPLVGEDEAAVHLDALLLVPEVGGCRAATDRDQQQVRLVGVAALDGDLDAGVGALDLLERLAGLERDAALAERPLERLGRLLVLRRQQAGERFDDGHVDAEGLPGARELAADDAAAEHDGRVRHVVEGERVLGGDDPLAVDLQAGQRLGVRAGGQHDVAADVALVAHLDGVLRDQAALALDVGDLAGPDQALQTLVEAADHAVLIGVDGLHVDAVEGGLDAELVGLAGGVGDLPGVQQSLGRDAATVQTGPADLVLLDQHDRQVELGGAQGGRVSAAAATEDYDVVAGIRVAHVYLPVHGDVPITILRHLVTL